MTDYEIKCVLMKENADNKRILREVVEKRILETSKEKFNLQDIFSYSEYFNVTMPKFLLEVLAVTVNDYKKFIKGDLKYISSEKFLKQKYNLIKKARTKYKFTVNWNRRNYYNRDKIIKRAKTYKVNAYDFSVGVLQKSKESTRKVLNDESSIRRLYVGKYVNAKLPKEYFNKYYEELRKTVKMAIGKAMNRTGRRLNKYEFEEELQKGLVFLFENGNSLNKFSKPIIQNAEYKILQQKRMFWKVYYFVLLELYDSKYSYSYIDNMKNDACEEEAANDDEGISDFIDSLDVTEFEEKILYLINDGYTKEEIVSKENITVEEYEQMMEKMMQKLRWRKEEMD